jgi:hypothetical protein
MELVVNVVEWMKVVQAACPGSEVIPPDQSRPVSVYQGSWLRIESSWCPC